MSNWLFHGNPKRFPVLDHLHDGESDIDWLITQHLDDVSIGYRFANPTIVGRGSHAIAGRHVGQSFASQRAGRPRLLPADTVVESLGGWSRCG